VISAKRIPQGYAQVDMYSLQPPSSLGNRDRVVFTLPLPIRTAFAELLPYDLFYSIHQLMIDHDTAVVNPEVS